MNHFIEHIIARHSNHVAQVQPRLTGRFESQRFASNNTDSVEGFEQADSIPTNLNDYAKVLKTSIPNSKINSVTGNIENENKEATTSLFSENSSLQINLENNIISNSNPDKKEFFQNGNTNLKSDHFMSKADTKPNIQSELPNSDSEYFPFQTQELNDFSTNRNQIENTHRLDGAFFNTNPSLTGMSIADELKMPVNNTNAGQSVIKVSIGRIDVRANSAPAQIKNSGNTSPNTKMSLEDYFKSRKNT